MRDAVRAILDAPGSNKVKAKNILFLGDSAVMMMFVLQAPQSLVDEVMYQCMSVRWFLIET